MARSKSSSRWLKEHFDDPFVKMAQKDGYRSRASYKLVEIQEKDRILRPGMTVIDLGSAPGGWSQVTSRVMGDKGTLIASDILPMSAIADVTFIEGDFTEDKVFNEIMDAVGNQPVDLVISDMAPNMSGVRTADQAAAMYLCELALDLATKVLRPGGDFLIKIFPLLLRQLVTRYTISAKCVALLKLTLTISNSIIVLNCFLQQICLKFDEK